MVCALRKITSVLHQGRRKKEEEKNNYKEALKKDLLHGFSTSSKVRNTGKKKGRKIIERKGRKTGR